MISVVSQFCFKQKLEAKPGINYGITFVEYKTEPTLFPSKAQLDPNLFLKLWT